MTNIFKWNDDLGTGFGDIDLQHKKLILVIEEVNANLQKEGAEYTLGMSKALKQLTDYTQYHFSEEESFMRKYAYPGFGQHRQKHAVFIEHVQEQIKILTFANPGNGYQFYRFLGTWLISHIAKEDQQWAAFIKEETKKK